MYTFTTACCVADGPRRRHQFDAVHRPDRLRQRRHLLGGGLPDDLDGRDARTPGTPRRGCRRTAGPARDGGSSWAPELRSSIRSAGAARMPRISSTPPTTSHGRRCVQRASREKKPSSGATSPSRFGQLPDPGDPAEQPGFDHPGTGHRQQCRHQGQRDQQGDHHDADPGGADRPRIRAWKISSPDRLIATVMPENITVRPAVRHRRHQGVGARGPGRSGGARAEVAAQFLPVAGHDQQAVVDAQPEPEHRHHVDDGGVQVDQVGEPEQHGQRAADGGDRAADRHSGGQETAEHQHHDQQADRQRDQLAARPGPSRPAR